MINNLPVITSTISPAAIAQFVAGKYSLDRTTTCSLIKAGINHTYRIENRDNTFIFRVYSYNWRTKDEIIAEISLLNILKEHNISISYPIVDKVNTYIQELQAPEGRRYAVLFSFAPGKKILNFGTETHFEIGKHMARIHRVTKNLRLHRVTYNANTLLNTSLKSIQRFLPMDTKEMDFLVATKEILETALTVADAENIRHGIVHIDIWFDNFNIADDNTITLFDFDFCGNGWLCLDIAYYLLQVHNTEKNEQDRKQKIKNFLNGYESIEPISDEEKRLLPTLGVCLYYFYLGVQSERFENWSNTFVNEVYLKRFVEVLVKGYYEATKNGIITE